MIVVLDVDVLLTDLAMTSLKILPVLRTSVPVRLLAAASLCLQIL